MIQFEKRPTRHRATAIALTAALALGSTARAETQDFPVERMRGTLDRNGIISLESGSVPGHLNWDVGLWVGYARNPLVVSRLSDGERLGALVSSRLGGSLIASVGLFSWAQLGLEVPFIAFQDRPTGMVPEVTSAPLSALTMAGVGDLRVVPKFGLLQTSEGDLFDLALVVPFSLPTSGGTNYFGDSGVVVAPEVAATVPAGRWRFGANFSAPFRKTVKIVDQTIESEMLVGVGAARRFFDDKDRDLPLEVSVTATGGTSLAAPFENRNQGPLEARAQAGWWFTPDFEGTLGGGVGIVNGWGTPDWRVFAGVRYSPAPALDTDGDGILDKDDKCPKDAEDKDGFQDADGCPEPDNDNDGIPDAADKCPGQAEDKDGFQDEDGCPDTDNDNDGIMDSADKCPNAPEDKDGFQDADGCAEPDNDGDGILDAADKCPNDAEDKDGFQDEDGCAEPDNDKDGIRDVADKCPNDAEDKDQFQDEDGCPDPDNDGDGVPDVDDKCPLQPGAVESAGCVEPDRDADKVIDRLDNCPDEPGTPENNGCKAKQLVAISAGKLEIVDSVYFKLGKDIIEKRSYELLDNVASVIKAHPEIAKVTVEGHTDNQGKADKNVDLSQRRAAAVKKYLAKKGVEDARLDAKGYGQERPIASNDNEEGRAKNRRVVFVIGDGTGVQKSDNGPTADTIEKPKDTKPASESGKKSKKKGGK